MEQRKDKKDRVCPPGSTLRHQYENQSKVQRKPESPTPESEAESGYSGLSFRSDRSKDVIDFKSGRPSAGGPPGITCSYHESSYSSFKDLQKCQGLTHSMPIFRDFSCSVFKNNQEPPGSTYLSSEDKVSDSSYSSFEDLQTQERLDSFFVIRGRVVGSI